MMQFSSTFHIHCIWHISQNLPKQLKGKLGSSFSDFIKDFYKARNSLKEEQFNERYFKMISFFFYYYFQFIIYDFIGLLYPFCIIFYLIKITLIYFKIELFIHNFFI